MTEAHAPRVVVVEDNPAQLAEQLFQLRHAGIVARGAGSAAELDALLAEAPCDVLVLDVNLPGEDGFSIAQRLYAPDRLGIVMLTVRAEVEDRVRGMERGADIYLLKPVDRRELLACIHSLHRRLAPTPWRLDCLSRELVDADGRVLGLTPQEVKVMRLLLQPPGDICQRNEIVAAFGLEYIDFPEARLNTLLSRLRQKLGGFDPALRIQTWRNSGYSYIGPEIVLVEGGRRLREREASPGPSAARPG